MRDKKYNYVYITTCLINNKKYIGSHSCDTLNNTYLGSGSALKEAIRQYGKDNFTKTIIAVYDTREQAYEAESKLLNDFWFATDTYNIYKTSSGLISHSDDAKAKMSQTKAGEKNPMYGKPSPNKGREKSALSKILISQKLKGCTAGKKQVIHKATGAIYDSIKEAADAHEISYPVLKAQLARKSLNCQFDYYNNNESLTSNSDVQ